MSQIRCRVRGSRDPILLKPIAASRDTLLQQLERGQREDLHSHCQRILVDIEARAVPALGDARARVRRAEEHQAARRGRHEKAEVVREAIAPVLDDIGLANDPMRCSFDGTSTVRCEYCACP